MLHMRVSKNIEEMLEKRSKKRKYFRKKGEITLLSHYSL